jgi:hypothetical protein
MCEQQYSESCKWAGTYFSKGWQESTTVSLCVSELHDAVFVVGALDETVMLRGMRYHPIDIENSVMRCHKKIAEW